MVLIFIKTPNEVKSFRENGIDFSPEQFGQRTHRRHVSGHRKSMEQIPISSFIVSL